VVDELPKTSTGKIQKNVVRQHHAALFGGDDQLG
jgi:acyl-coenzyme A synthetase/AMP-(fatty) acid ligase